MRDDGRCVAARLPGRTPRAGRRRDRRCSPTRRWSAPSRRSTSSPRCSASHGVPPERVRFCATSATRDASNAAVFAEGVRRRLGVEPEVLSGDEEAALVYAGAIAALGPPIAARAGARRRHRRRVDRAGAGAGRHRASRSRWTSGRCASTSGTCTPTRRPPSEVAACVADIDRHLDESGVPLDARPHRHRHLRHDQDDRVRRPRPGRLRPRRLRPRRAAQRRDTATSVDRLLAMTVAERRALPYMHPGRADVIGAGALIWSRILARVPVDDPRGLRGRHPPRHRGRHRPMTASRERACPHPVTGQELRQPGAARDRLARRPGGRRTPRWRATPTTYDASRAASPLRRARRPRQRLRGLPAAGAWREDVARREAGVVRRPALLGAADRRVGRPRARAADRRAGAGGQRRQPHRADLHRRPQRGLALRQPAPHRLGGPADQRARRRRAAPASTRGWSRPCAARRRTTSRPRSSATPAPRGSPRRSGPAPAAPCGSSWRSASFGWDGALRSLVGRGAAPRRRREPRFGHGAEVGRSGDVTLIGCYHPSPHNTYTRRLTREMTDDVFARRDAALTE